MAGEVLDRRQVRHARAWRGRRSPAAIGCSEASSTAPARRRTSASSARGGERGRDHRHLPRGHRPGLVEDDGVDPPRRLEHLGALDQQPELGAAAGPDQQRGRRGEPERAGAGDDQDRDRGGEGEGRPGPVAEPEAERADGEGDHDRDEDAADPIGEALDRAPCPVWASVTRRAIWARAVSSPTRVARTTSRPPALIVAPTTSSPGPTSTGTDSPVSSAWSTAEEPRSTTPSVATFSPGRTTKRSPTARLLDRDAALLALLVEHGDVLGAQVEQGLERRPGAALGPLLEVAAGEDEGGDDGGDLEVDVVGGGAALGDELERHRHPRRAGVEEEEGDQRPAPGGQRADRDQRVHRRGAVAEVLPGGLVEGPARPEHDRRGQLQRQPLPVLELQRLDHREQQDRQRERRSEDQAPAQRRRSGSASSAAHRRPPRRPPGRSGRVAGLANRLDQLLRLDPLGVEADRRPLGGEVDRRLDAVDLVEALLDPVRARGAGHALDRQADPLCLDRLRHRFPWVVTSLGHCLSE